MDPKITAAIIAAFVSIFTLLITSLIKPFWEKHFHKFKLKSVHDFEQRKQIKEAISKNKTMLLNSAESLNHRLWNFSKNSDKKWHSFNENDNLEDKYYLVSFCYRFLAFFAWCRIIEKT